MIRETSLYIVIEKDGDYRRWLRGENIPAGWHLLTELESVMMNGHPYPAYDNNGNLLTKLMSLKRGST